MFFFFLLLQNTESLDFSLLFIIMMGSVIVIVKRKPHFSNGFETPNRGCIATQNKAGKKKNRSLSLQWSERSEIVVSLVFFFFFLASHVIKTDLANHWICTQTKCSTLLWFFIATLLSKDWMCWYLDLSAFNICQRQNVN